MLPVEQGSYNARLLQERYNTVIKVDFFDSLLSEKL